MKCPRDGSDLQLESYWKYPRSTCPSCNGYFLGHRDAMETVGSQKIATFPPGKAACPVDGTLMRVFTYRQVELDICPSCGSVWLDGGELKKVAPKKEPTSHTSSGGAYQGDDDSVGTFILDGLDSIIDGLTD